MTKDQLDEKPINAVLGAEIAFEREANVKGERVLVRKTGTVDAVNARGFVKMAYTEGGAPVTMWLDVEKVQFLEAAA